MRGKLEVGGAKKSRKKLLLGQLMSGLTYVNETWYTRSLGGDGQKSR